MSDISIPRLYLLRAMYLLMAVGLGITIWPSIIVPGDVSDMSSVVRAILGAFAVMALWGLRYPIKMLPILLLELIWKGLWVAAFGLGPLLHGQLDAAKQDTLYACLMGLILTPIVVPWGYVYRHYVNAQGDRWRGKSSST